MLKRIIIFLSLLFIAFTFPAAAQNDPEIFSSNDWSYSKNDTGWTISSYIGNSVNIEIPAEIDEIPVTKLSAELFKNNNSLASIQIPDSVTSIEKNAFFGCTSLKEAKLSKNLKAIPEGCFRYCLSLEHIELPYILTSIGKDAFSDCLALREIFIPPNVMTIGETAFAYCVNLESVSVPRTLTTVNSNAFVDTAWFDQQTEKFVFVGRGILLKYNGKEKNVEIPYGTASISNAFQGNVHIESVVLPQTVKQITQNAFRDAVNLSTINIPDFVTTIGASAFEGCSSLVEITLPSSVTSLGSSAFRSCTHLTKLDIPELVKSLPARVAGDCPNLVSVKIPESVTAINTNAFAGSNNIQIKIIPGSPAEDILKNSGTPYIYYQASAEDYTYNINGTEIEITHYNGSHKFIEIPAQIAGIPVTSIGEAAFQGNSFIRTISVPFTIKTIGDYAFSNMPNLNSVWLSFGLENIGSHVFSGSNALFEINIPQGVKAIGKDIIDVSSLTNICVIPGSAAEQILLDSGFRVLTPESCFEEIISADKWAVENLYAGTAVNLSQTETSGTPQNINVQTENIKLIRIPNGTLNITADMIPETDSALILFVPSSTVSIDSSVLVGKSVSIAGEKDSFAERFSLDNGLNFISQVISDTGIF